MKESLELLKSTGKKKKEIKEGEFNEDVKIDIKDDEGKDEEEESDEEYPMDDMYQNYGQFIKKGDKKILHGVGCAYLHSSEDARYQLFYGEFQNEVWK